MQSELNGFLSDFGKYKSEKLLILQGLPARTAVNFSKPISHENLIALYDQGEKLGKVDLNLLDEDYKEAYKSNLPDPQTFRNYKLAVGEGKESVLHSMIVDQKKQGMNRQISISAVNTFIEKDQNFSAIFKDDIFKGYFNMKEYKESLFFIVFTFYLMSAFAKTDREEKLATLKYLELYKNHFNMLFKDFRFVSKIGLFYKSFIDRRKENADLSFKAFLNELEDENILFYLSERQLFTPNGVIDLSQFHLFILNLFKLQLQKGTFNDSRSFKCILNTMFLYLGNYHIGNFFAFADLKYAKRKESDAYFEERFKNFVSLLIEFYRSKSASPGLIHKVHNNVAYISELYSKTSINFKFPFAVNIYESFIEYFVENLLFKFSSSLLSNVDMIRRLYDSTRSITVLGEEGLILLFLNKMYKLSLKENIEHPKSKTVIDMRILTFIRNFLLKMENRAPLINHSLVKPIINDFEQLALEVRIDKKGNCNIRLESYMVLLSVALLYSGSAKNISDKMLNFIRKLGENTFKMEITNNRKTKNKPIAERLNLYFKHSKAYNKAFVVYSHNFSKNYAEMLKEYIGNQKNKETIFQQINQHFLEGLLADLTDLFRNIHSLNEDQVKLLPLLVSNIYSLESQLSSLKVI